QLDQLSPLWWELRDAMLAIPADNDTVRLGLDLLDSWDGVVSADSPAAAVFELFVAEMTRRLVQTKAPNAAEWAMGKSAAPLMTRSGLCLRRFGHLSRLIRQQPDGWFARGWPREMAAALGQMVRMLGERYGDDPAQWAWGRVRPLCFEHAVGGRAPLDKIFNLGPFPWGGDACTVAQAAVNLSEPYANSFFTASLRMVVDVGNWDASRYILPGGQSGNPLSPHYADQFPLWQRGKGVSIAWSPDKVDQVTQSVLHLRPK
ncbi:MAG: penicillin acylase family protein, partial [Anaerolineae bacterium]|nr:penicillin acylase family protein [Anaerolineae bacterium]